MGQANGELAGHAQMHAESAVSQWKVKKLPVTLSGLQGLAHQSATKFFDGLASQHIRVCHFRLHDGASENEIGEAASDGFYFREFWHV